MQDKIFNFSAGLQHIAAFSCLMAKLHLLKELEIC
jgi:hypothetical protein